MEGIKEQLVKKRFEGSDRTKTILVLLASLIVAVAVFFLITYLVSTALVVVALILSGVILYGGYWLTGEFNIEYEYCYSSGEITVDKIINQRRRKHMCSVNLRTAEAFRINPEHISDSITTISAIGENGDIYGIEFNDPKYGKSILLFTPDDSMLSLIKPYLPRAI